MKHQKQEFKRPYATHYYASATDKTPAFSSQGAAASETGAIRATVVRIFENQYAMAIVHDRATGVALYTLRRQGAGISISYGSADSSNRRLYAVK